MLDAPRLPTAIVPSGAYYVMTDIAHFGFPDDVAFARHLVETIGVARCPAAASTATRPRGRTKVRFCFSKRDETMAEADRRLAKLRT